MIFKSFVFAGFICLIAQIIKDNTKLTSGHITSLFCSIGALLGFLGVYENIIENVGGGANVVIMSFGNSLYQAAINKGILNLLAGGSVGIVTAVLIGFLMALIFKVKD